MRQFRAIIFFIATLSLLFFSEVNFASAGFGITPPYVKNESLARNSVYEQKIIIVRGDPNEDLKAEITLDVPGANEWITIDRGQEFVLPAGEQKVPMVVKVQVPDEAEIKRYTGRIRIRTGPIDESKIEGVSIALGAQIDVDLSVVDEKIYNFRVRRITLSDLNEGQKWGWFFFPGKIKFKIYLENTGNVPIAPSRVAFDIYDFKGLNLLESVENTNRLSKIDPFDTGEITAELPTRLLAGNYVVRYRIYNLDEVKQEGELNLSILPYGTLAGDEGYGILGLTMKEKAILVFPLIVALSLISMLVMRRKKKYKKPKRSDLDNHILRLGRR